MVIDSRQFIKQFDEYKQISMTGSRALILLLALLESPKSFEEIRELLISCGVVTKEYSIDTIRIDINTLKAIGCQITKATKNNNHKYGLIYHPFNLTLTSEDVDALKSIYKKFIKTISPGKLLDLHKLFQKMADMVIDEKIKEELLGISILKGYNLQIIEELVSSEKIHNKVTISYQAANHKEPLEYDITLETLGLRNGKLYIFCYNHNLKERSFLNVSRIKAVLSSSLDRNSCYGLDVRVKFKLNNYKKYNLDENEVVVETNGDTAIIEGYYFNKFITVQRILSFASDCTIIEPDELIVMIVEKLKEMRTVYE